MRQSCFAPGAAKTWGFWREAARIMARPLADDWGAADTSTVSESAEIASAFAALALGAGAFEAGAGTGAGDAAAAPPTEPAWPATGGETLPSAMKLGAGG